MANGSDDLDFQDEDNEPLDSKEVDSFKDAVVYTMDWTVETVLTQLRQQNIEMNPRFQRRDAWGPARKSLFVESIFLGLPIPQIVLAEKRDRRGSFIVLDGKQRLLTLLQFMGEAETSEHNKFAIRGLEALKQLNRKRFADIQESDALADNLTTFNNHTIRTVVIRNWPSTAFLHLVFLRLNTGSLKLSPQELRQALIPGAFSDYVDDAAADSQALKELLSIDRPDPRMRDVELLVRFLAFSSFLSDYGGRMKAFLDESCKKLNKDWGRREKQTVSLVKAFEDGTEALVQIFGDRLARKLNSKSFNRAIFDTLIFYAADRDIRKAMLANKTRTVTAYQTLLEDADFAEAIESDTAGIPHTSTRLHMWGSALKEATKLKFRVPEIQRRRIKFDGFRG